MGATRVRVLSMRRVPVLADVEREQRGEQGDLLGEMLELALRDVELSDRLGCHGTRYGHGTCRASTPCRALHAVRARYVVRPARVGRACSAGRPGQAALSLGTYGTQEVDTRGWYAWPVRSSGAYVSAQLWSPG